MYRNYANLGRGTDQTFSDPGSGSSSSTVTTSATTAQQQHKYSVAGASQFVPSLNAITSNQDLQWLVQPSLLTPPGPPRPLRTPYMLPPRAGAMGTHPIPALLPRPGVIRAAAGTSNMTRRRTDDHLTQEELERRRVRRERNKMAAAKCRNRRRELTETLQGETDQLEDEKSRLQKEIAELQKEKDKLELVLEAHRPICKVPESESDSDSDSPNLPSLSGIKIEPAESDLPRPSASRATKLEKPKPKITIPPQAPSASTSAVLMETESLHTPILISTPSLTPFTASLVFTYPSSSMDTSSATASLSNTMSAASSSQHGVAQPPRVHEPCAIAHRRSSSSGDQSDHSLSSPTILTL